MMFNNVRNVPLATLNVGRVNYFRGFNNHWFLWKRKY